MLADPPNPNNFELTRDSLEISGIIWDYVIGTSKHCYAQTYRQTVVEFVGQQDRTNSVTGKRHQAH